MPPPPPPPTTNLTTKPSFLITTPLFFLTKTSSITLTKLNPPNTLLLFIPCTTRTPTLPPPLTPLPTLPCSHWTQFLPSEGAEAVTFSFPRRRKFLDLLTLLPGLVST
ncbi:hypothetical protein Golax_000006 [Gossypium laxum]|uniref:Uncharacterized protein n=1 Tax=Gossypium laxum TaxID=34288 RepID=A0A7J9B5L4_9ROSI|nr:hypothetical protein [Gossypium laxum]